MAVHSHRLDSLGGGDHYWTVKQICVQRQSSLISVKYLHYVFACHILLLFTAFTTVLSCFVCQECPSGVVNEETFKEIYAQFFPQGGLCRPVTWGELMVFSSVLFRVCVSVCFWWSCKEGTGRIKDIRRLWYFSFREEKGWYVTVMAQQTFSCVHLFGHNNG